MVGASTPCNDLVDLSNWIIYIGTCVKNAILESLDDLIAQENDELQQEVEKIKEDMVTLKCISNAQPLKNNLDNMVKMICGWVEPWHTLSDTKWATHVLPL